MSPRVLLILIGAGAAPLSGALNRDDCRPGTHIRVIDSTYTESWQPMEDTGTVYRIEVVYPLGADTIRNVIPPAPILVGDSLVIGLLQLSEDSCLLYTSPSPRD